MFCTRDAPRSAVLACVIAASLAGCTGVTKTAASPTDTNVNSSNRVAEMTTTEPAFTNRRVGVHFKITSYPETARPDVDEVFMDIYAYDDEVRGFVSRRFTKKGKERTITSRTTWIHDALTMQVEEPGRGISDVRMPTRPTVRAIIEDSIGPLDKPTELGYVKVDNATYEKEEGPVILRLTDDGNLGERLLEVLDPLSKKVQSRISDIRMVDGKKPMRELHVREVCRAGAVEKVLLPDNK